MPTTPPADPYHSPQLIDFYGEPSFGDPFLSSDLDNDEQLMPAVVNETYRTPSPLSTAKLDHHNSQHPTNLSSTYYSHSDQQSLAVNGGHTPSAVPDAQEEPDGYATSSQDLLSPNDNPYPSDHYPSDYSDTPGYSLWLTEEFGPLVSTHRGLEDFDFSDSGTGGASPYQINVERDTTRLLNGTQKASSGTATNLVSHLMSPVLTDKASPMSGTGVPDQPLNGHSSKERDNNTSAFIGLGDSMDPSNLQVDQMQHTPALTGSSLNTSPERSDIPPIARAASPVVRIESYTRGDSPARVARPMMRSGSKRRRGGSRSSFLTVQDDESSDEDAADADRYREQQRVGSPTGLRPAEVGTEGRIGLDPPARAQVGNAEVPNLKDQDDAAQAALRKADVEDWLAHSENGSIDSPDTLADRPRPNFSFNRRRRAKSTGDNTLSRANLDRLRNDPSIAAGPLIPGPGLLLDEESDEEADEDDEEFDGEDEGIILPESPPSQVEVNDPSEFDPRGSPYLEDMPQINETPPPLYRVHLWEDPLRDPTDPGCQMQPVTSNQAIVLYEQRSRDFETLSRVATWGTRRLSESDLPGLFNRFSFKEEKDPEKLKGERRGNFLDKLLSRRASLLKRKESDSSKVQPSRPPPTAEHPKKDSISSRKESLGVPTLQRMPSLGKRPKSPKINTISAVAAMGNQIAAVGASGPLSATTSPTNAWTATKNIIRRTRSRSELCGSLPTNKITDLWTKTGGPPMPTLASPANMEQSNMRQQTPPPLDDDDDDEDVAEEKGVTIDFSLRADPIIPKLEGFKSNVQQLNPRLPRYMVDRVAQEQLRRHKKLMDFKVKHVQAVHTGKCSSEKHCTELGGEPTYLPSKSSSREPEHSHTGFSIVNPAPSDEDVSALAEGIVTPAQFPQGVPMPPVKRLPAEFECSLCFKVKKFHKPSDWSKHVHEDVQPFTCTFQTCADPKSFKRKADWVRHENERHRQLEWWQCNMSDCSHKCFRKDNFVQHLVREHKLPEPKIKTAKASKVRGPSTQKRKAQGDDGHDDSSNDEIEQVWKLVEECRHETLKNPKDEPCVFCGNICTSWKKLTVHLAKHMEQISMPVLTVVKETTVTPETVISPIEQRISQQVSMSPTVSIQYTHHTSPMSPYGTIPDPRGEFPFVPVAGQTSFYRGSTHDATAAGSYHRGQPSTYPPPTSYSVTRHSPNPSTYYGPKGGAEDMKTDPDPVYTQPRDSYFSGYSYEPSPGSQNISAAGGFNNSQSSSPETIYGVLRGPTSQPRSAPYVVEDVFQPGYQQQQQSQSALQQFAGSFGTPMGNYRGATQLSYPPQAGVPGIQLHYSGCHPEMAFSRSQADLSVYTQQQLQQSPPIQQQEPTHQTQTQSQAQIQARAQAHQQQRQQERQGYPFHQQ